MGFQLYLIIAQWILPNPQQAIGRQLVPIERVLRSSWSEMTQPIVPIMSKIEGDEVRRGRETEIEVE
jgi:hypothetical protein